MLVERDLRLSQCAKRLEVVTLLLKIAPVEAAEDSRQVFGPTSSSAVGQVTLGVQEIDTQDAVENFAAAAIPTRKRRGYVAVLGDHVGVEPRRIKHKVAQLILIMQSIAQIITKVSWRRVKHRGAVRVFLDCSERALAGLIETDTCRVRVYRRIGDTHPDECAVPSETRQQVNGAMNILRPDFQPNIDFHGRQRKTVVARTECNDPRP